MRRLSLPFAAALFAATSAALAQPLTTAFTYQGELKQSGTPATGTFDLQFKLYDAISVGSQIGTTICIDNVVITGGRFARTLDFGNAFSGQKRFLEVSVRADATSSTPCSTLTGYTTLIPRQELTVAPNAAFALTAATATSATTANSATTATTATTATNSTQLNGQNAAFYQNAANLTAGPLPAGLLSGTYTGLLTFNNASNAFSGSFSGSGAGLTTLNATNLSSGTVADARLSTNVALLGSTQTFTATKTFSVAPSFTAASVPFSVTGTGVVTNLNADMVDGFSAGAFGQLAGNQAWSGINNFSNAGNSFVGSFNGNGSLLTSLNAANIASGALADARLSSNVALLGSPQTFSATKTFSAAPSFTAVGTPFSVTSTGVVTNLNADLLDGLSSSAFLQSVPVPLTLTGSAAAHVLRAENTSVISGSKAIYGVASGLTGTTNGGYFQSVSTQGTGVFARGGLYGLEAVADNGTAIFAHSTYGGYGVYASSDSFEGNGVFGAAFDTSSQTYGGRFESYSPLGAGVFGKAWASTGGTSGGFFQSDSAQGFGVRGVASAATGTTHGGLFTATSTQGTGVSGAAWATSGTTYGGYFQSASNEGTGAFASGGTYGVEAVSNSGTGIYAQGLTGAVVWGSGSGVVAYSSNSVGTGVYGEATSYTGENYGGYFRTWSPSGWSGFFKGGQGVQVQGGAGPTSLTFQPGKYYGVDTANKATIDIPGTGDLLFWDNVHVNNVFTAGTKNFLIDHPQDPLNKTLRHSCVESDAHKNMYDGTVRTDSSGHATITLPSWFSALNQDYRYQLTVVEDQDSGVFIFVKVAKKIENGAFTIRTSLPNVEVCWQVTGIRKDVFALANPLIVEEQKPEALRGRYMHPEAFELLSSKR